MVALEAETENGVDVVVVVAVVVGCDGCGLGTSSNKKCVTMDRSLEFDS